MRFLTTPRRAISWAVLLAGIGALFWLLAPVLAPFVIGAVLAYALHPAVEKLAGRRVPRLLAVILVELAAGVALLALALLVVPILSKELPLLHDQLPVLVERIDGAVAPRLARLGVHVPLDPESLRAFFVNHLDANWDDSIAKALVSARVGGSIVIAVFGYVVLIPVVLFYLLVDWPLYIERGVLLVPPRWRGAVASLARECDAVLGQYLRGQLLVMLILAAYYSVGLALFGFELAVPVGVFTGLAIFVPYVGFGIGLALALLAGALQFTGWYGPVAVFVVYGIGQILEAMLLTPKLVGQRIGMSPLTVIFALFTFGHLFGFVGVVIALPVSALLAVAAARLRAGYTASGLYIG